MSADLWADGLHPPFRSGKVLSIFTAMYFDLGLRMVESACELYRDRCLDDCVRGAPAGRGIAIGVLIDEPVKAL